MKKVEDVQEIMAVMFTCAGRAHVPRLLVVCGHLWSGNRS